MPGLQEYVLRLSTDVDNVGVQKLFSLLDTNKMKALGLTAALTAATTAVYKWVESATKEEIALQKLAKEKHKSIEQTRAEQEALKQMGVTLNDIKKDKALKSIYDDLVKFNKEMQMPNAAHAIGKVRELQGAFWKLKSAVSYLVQSIGSQLLINLEKPIERITNKLNKGANWIKNNLTSIGTKITGYLTAFSKGIIGIVEGVGKIFNWLGQMPEGIKSIAGTLETVFALIKSGPIGQIFALITAAGDLIHDFENSQWNKENKENTTIWNDGKGGWTDEKTEFGAYQVPLMYENLWNFLENDTGSLREKAKTITLSILEGITEALNSFSDTLNSGEGLTDWLKKLTGPVGDILGGVEDALGGEEGQKRIAGILVKFFNVAADLCKGVGRYGSQIFGSVAEMIANIFGKEDIWKSEKIDAAFSGKNGFANGMMTAITTALVGGNWLESILTGVMSGYSTEREKAIKKLYEQDHPELNIDWEKAIFGDEGGMGLPNFSEIEEKYKNDPRLSSLLGSGVQSSFNEFLKSILGILVGGINIASDVCGNILNTIIQAVIQGLLDSGDQGIADNVSEALNSEGAKDVMDSIGAGIGTWIMSGNFFAGILGSVVSFISQSIETAKTTNKPLWDVMKDKVSDFWDSIQDIIYGPLLEGQFNADGTQKRDRQYGLISVLEPLLWGEMETVGDTVQNVLEEAEDKVTGKKYFARKGGILNWLLGYDTTEVGTGEKFRVKGIFEKAWEGEDGQGGIKSFFTNVAEKIGEWLEPVGDAVKVFFKNMWVDIFNNLPGWMKTILGLKNPNSSTVSEDEETGEVTVSSTSGQKKTFAKGGISKNAQAVLNKFGGYYEIDENGKVVMTNGGDSIRSINNDGSGSALFNAPGRVRLQDALQYIIDNGVLPGEGTREGARVGENTGPFQRWNVNYDNAEEFMKAFAFENGEGQAVLDVMPNVDVTKIQSQIDAGTYHVNADVIVNNSGDDGSNNKGPSAMGGRFDKATERRIAEAGAEYIIPATKPERAFSLVLQLLTEMGGDMIKRVISHFGGAESSLSEGISGFASSAASRVGKDFSLGTGGTIGGSMGSLETALQNMQQNYNYNISAPVSIIVNSNANAEDVGRAAYSAAERSLMKTLRGAWA